MSLSARYIYLRNELMYLLKIFLKIRSFFFTFVVKRRLLNYGSIKVNGISWVPKGRVSVGKNVNFNGMTIKGRGLVTIGDHFHSGENCKILSSSHNWKGKKIPYDSTHILKEVTIGDCVWFGDNVLILPGSQICDGAIVQAGSVVHGIVPELHIVGGNPATKIGERERKSFYELQSQQQFH